MDIQQINQNELARKAEINNTVISALATFVGAITGISNRKYNKEEK